MKTVTITRKPIRNNIEGHFRRAAKGRFVCKLVDVHGNERTVEPYGVFYPRASQKKQLCCFQIGGYSESGNLPEWRNPYVDKIQEIIILKEKYRKRKEFNPDNEQLYPDWDWHI